MSAALGLLGLGVTCSGSAGLKRKPGREFRADHHRGYGMWP